ncbi:hypothetical protein IWX86_001769 [Polaromonas sp. CG_9.2]|uniref:hypothetical protein n=1 Tax=unclassified Polaromonas TaxID=2638319 RepID=UPI0018CAF07E|nr:MULTISPECIES: hypothetical protein [unclassified Polaromonas]MBG6114010.1 hypothetical protein [Polaromonas sp. CG_9.2]MDH6184905.1 hypothetical protein [Polaromonas sp. CG_23.6]
MKIVLHHERDQDEQQPGSLMGMKLARVNMTLGIFQCVVIPRIACPLPTVTFIPSI